jgi:hypothetical protein
MADPERLADLASAVDCLAQRMDCFYAWATQLQQEIRELKKARPPERTVPQEVPDEASLLRRIEALRGC